MVGGLQTTAEFGSGTGLLGLLSFVWFLVELLRFGIGIQAQASHKGHTLMAGCLAGIVASLGWGLLDVMDISPPFLTFPTWALVGLLLSAPRAFGVPQKGGNNAASESRAAISRFVHRAERASRQALRLVLPTAPLALLCILALLAVVSPLLGHLHYRAAYAAFQERCWDTASSGLERASHWEPLNAQYLQLRGMALINQGRYDEAISAYERAVRLRRGFAPYHAQLGWLYWLRGDLERGTTHLRQAVEMDPREAWREGLHADLGLAHMAQGQVAEALSLFQKAIQLDPEIALASYWVRAIGADGEYDVVLDPTYLNTEVQGSKPTEPLRTRILAHLGKADYTPRLYSREFTTEDSPSINQVLDSIEADYDVARAAASATAPRLLAAAAEASRVVGLLDRAERAYLSFSRAYPQSAYGFRGLGTVYRERGQLPLAQEMLERAAEVSARDIHSWRGIAEVALDRMHWEEAEQALEAVEAVKPLDPRLYELRTRLYRERGALDLSAAASNQALYLQESVADRLTLADLYRQLGQLERATQQCTQAAEALWRTQLRPLDTQLWEVGSCFASSGQDVPSFDACDTQPVACQVLRGHVHSARGQFDRALKAYQLAGGILDCKGHTDDGAARYWIGQVHQAQGGLELAEATYRQAARRDPLESLPLLTLGQMLWAQEHRESAVESLRAAVKTTPGWDAAHVALGNALLVSGDRDAAARHYQLAQAVAQDIHQDVVYDFAANLAEADVKSHGPGYVRIGEFAIEGSHRRVVFAHPESQITYRVALKEDTVLAFDVATDPESWPKAGDGVTFAVYLESEPPTHQETLDASPLGSNNGTKLFSTYIDPKGNQADRRWHSFTLDLEAYGEHTVTIVFETLIGPLEDGRYDWAGWGRPRLLRALRGH